MVYLYDILYGGVTPRIPEREAVETIKNIFEKHNFVRGDGTLTCAGLPFTLRLNEQDFNQFKKSIALLDPNRELRGADLYTDNFIKIKYMPAQNEHIADKQIYVKHALYDLEGKSPYEILFGLFDKDLRPEGVDEFVLIETRNILINNNLVSINGLGCIPGSERKLPSELYNQLRDNLKSLKIPLEESPDGRWFKFIYREFDKYDNIELTIFRAD